MENYGGVPKYLENHFYPDFTCIDDIDYNDLDCLYKYFMYIDVNVSLFRLKKYLFRLFECYYNMNKTAFVNI